jgi:hypothetical protein
MISDYSQRSSNGQVSLFFQWIWTCEQAITADGSCEWK